MGKANIDIRALFKYSFGLFKEYASFIIGVSTTYFILALVPQVYLYLYAPKDPTVESQIISTLAMVVQLYLSLGFTKIMLYLVDHRQVEVVDLINNGANFLNYFVAYFMYVLVIGVFYYLAVSFSFILMLPGIYLAIRLQFYPYYIIDYDDASFEAIRKSWHATNGWTLQLFLFGICLLFINFIGVFCLIVGVIVTYPITTLATAVIFRGLTEETTEIPTANYLPG